MENVGTLDRGRGYMAIAELLREEIGTLALHKGDRLPAERELAQRLRVSRPSLREALVALEVLGEVEIRLGSGVYLRQMAYATESGDGADVTADVLGHSPEEVNQMRSFLEAGVAGYAARFIGRKQLKTLAESITTMREVLDGADGTNDRPLADADRLFHVTLSSTTGNSLLGQTLGDLFDQRYTTLGGALHRLFDNRQVWQEAICEHQDIYDAVAEGDPFQAQAAMQRHLARAHARLLGAIG